VVATFVTTYKGSTLTWSKGREKKKRKGKGKENEKDK